MLSHSEYLQMTQGMAFSPQNSAVTTTLLSYNQDPKAALNQMMQMRAEQIIQLAKDNSGGR